MADGRKRRFNRIGGSQRLSVCRWKMIERQQFLTTVGQATHRTALGNLSLIGADEAIKLALHLTSGCCGPDLVQIMLRFRRQ